MNINSSRLLDLFVLLENPHLSIASIKPKTAILKVTSSSYENCYLVNFTLVLEQNFCYS